MINDILEELLNVIQSFDQNIENEPNAIEFVKDAKIQITTHDNIIFQLQLKYKEGEEEIEKIVSVNRINEQGDLEVFDIEDDCDNIEKLREIEPLSKFLN